MYANVVPPPVASSDRLRVFRALVREVYEDMSRRNPDSIPSVRYNAAKGQAWKLLAKAGW